jgi:hypothetical protein
MTSLPRRVESPAIRQFRIEWGSFCGFLATLIIACRITAFSHALEALWFSLCMYIIVGKLPFNKSKIPFLTCILAVLLLLSAFRLSYTGRLCVAMLVMTAPLVLSIASRDEKTYPVLWFAIAVTGSAMALSQDALSIRYAEALGLDVFVSRIVTVLSGSPGMYGPTYLGLDLALLYTLTCPMIFLLSQERNPGMLVTYFLLGIVSYLVCLLVFTKNLGLGGLGYVPFVLCLAICLSVLVGLYASSDNYCLVWNRTAYVKGLAGMVIALLVCAVSAIPMAVGRVQKSVMFLAAPDLDFGPSSPHDFNDKFRPSFGWLPVYLEGTGYKVSWGEISPLDLSDVQIVVGINVRDDLSEYQQKALQDFVYQGGSLLVLADHTFYPDESHPFDCVMAPAGIGVNFDSARSILEEGWGRGNLKFNRHPITTKITDEAQTQIGTGASLRVKLPGKPIVVATHGFADAADLMNCNSGYLGDLKHNPGERLGDLIVVAEGSFGRGKVLVFGDTSPFQNGALALSRDFLDNVFSWMSHRRAFPSQWLPHFVFLACAIASFILAWRATSKEATRRATLGMTVLYSFLAAAIAGLILLEIPVFFCAPQKTRFQGATAIIDRSHSPSFSSELWGVRGIGGLYQNVLRNQLLPVQMEEFDENVLYQAETVFIIGAQQSYSKKEIDFLEKYAEDGGRLIIATGWEESRGTKNLAERFGFTVEPVPLGGFQVETAWGVLKFKEGWGVSTSRQDAITLVSVWGRPVAAYRQLGQGRVTVIGDSMFLENMNLETLSEVNIANIEFLRSIAF